MKEQRRYRMYGLVPYNISPIQQGIQFGHSVVEYGLYANEMDGKTLDTYLDWATNDKVFIILNGGTTNSKLNPNDMLPIGTLNQHLDTLDENKIQLSTFYEEDLGDQLTAITFLVDNRVWDTETYPDQEGWGESDPSYPFYDYDEWVHHIGGKKNEFLREFLKQFRLA